MAKRETVQKLGLDASEYSSGLKKANQQTKSSFMEMNTALVGSSKQFKNHEDSVLKWSKIAGQEFAKARKSFNENVVLGMKATALGAGIRVMNAAGDAAVDLGFKFSKTFADVSSMSNANEKQLKDWRDGILKIGSDTGASLSDLSTSFANLFTSVKDPKELMSIMNVLGESSQLTDGKSIESAATALKSLKEQGKEVNAKNIGDFLSAANVLRRNSAGIEGGQAGAVKALGSMSGQDIKNSGFSMREIANIVAAATQTKGLTGEKGVTAINDLLKMSSNPLMVQAAFKGILGGDRAGALVQNGKLNMSELTSAGTRERIKAMGGKNQAENMEIFKLTSGLGETSDMLYNLIMDGDKFAEANEKAAKDVTSLADSSKKAGDNLETAWTKMVNNMIMGFTDMFSSLEKSAKSLFTGNIFDAVKQGIGALPDVIGGIAKHAGLATASVGSMWATGAGLKSILSTVSGMNAPGAAAAGTGSRILGALNPYGKVAMAGLAGYTAGTALNDHVIDPLTTQENQYGQKSNMTERAIGMAAVGLHQAIPSMGISEEEFKDMYGKKQEVEVKVIIESNDPMFSARPKANDNPKDARTH